MTPPQQHPTRKPNITVSDHDHQKQRKRTAFLPRSLSLTQSTHNVGFERSSTPTSEDESSANEPPEFVSRPRDLSDDEEENAQPRASRRKGGYDSRIEQILYENEDLQILITDAGKNHESGGSYIAYTIRTGVNLTSEGRLMG